MTVHSALLPLVLSCADVLTSQLGWEKLSVLTRRRGHAMTFDPVRGRVLLFGGYGDNEEITGAGVWEWDGVRWTHRPAANGPDGRSQMAIATQANGRTVKFGGEYPANHTWEWDGWTWHQRAPSNRPPSRQGPAMAYDPVRHRVVMFGGVGSGSLTDTWEWDGNDWTLCATSGPRPREAASMVFDPLRRTVLLFGGIDRLALLNDLWEWDGTSWRDVTPAQSPAPRSGAVLVHAFPFPWTVLFGGYTHSGVVQDLWIWDGSRWLQQVPATLPTARSFGSAAWDPTRLRMVLFGGFNNGSLGDTWEWDGARFRLAAPEAHPPARSAASLSWSVSTDEGMLFGGHTDSYASVPIGDTWLFDGERWRRAQPSSAPSARAEHDCVSLPDGRVLLFGGRAASGPTDDSWIWDGQDWRDVSTPIRPSMRMRHAMAFDAARNRVVLFGGANGSTSALADTWEWDGTSWLRMTPSTSPPARFGHGMAYDGTNRRILLHGGASGASPPALTDTWEWDGASWRQLFHGPSRSDHVMLEHLARGSVLLWGGWGPSYMDDAWEWNGAWRQTLQTNKPRFRFLPAMTYDPARERLVMFGGNGSAARPLILDDTWFCNSASPATAVQYGRGCAGTAGTLALDAGVRSRPWLGSSFEAHVAPLAAVPTQVLIGIGVSDARYGGLILPLDLGPIGMPGCTLLASMDFIVPTMSQAGRASWSAVIPNDPSWVGASFYEQAFAFDPLANPLGLVASNGLALRVGTR